MDCVPASAGVPTLAADKVARVLPRHGVSASRTHSVRHLAAAITPPGVEVTIVGALRVGSHLTSYKKLVSICDVDVRPVEAVKRTAKYCGKGRSGKKKRLERDHGGSKQGVLCFWCDTMLECFQQGGDRVLFALLYTRVPCFVAHVEHVELPRPSAQYRFKEVSTPNYPIFAEKQYRLFSYTSKTSLVSRPVPCHAIANEVPRVPTAWGKLPVAW